MEERGNVDILMGTDSVITNEDVGKILILNATGTLKNPVPPDINVDLDVTTI